MGLIYAEGSAVLQFSHIGSRGCTICGERSSIEINEVSRRRIWKGRRAFKMAHWLWSFERAGRCIETPFSSGNPGCIPYSITQRHSNANASTQIRAGLHLYKILLPVVPFYQLAFFTPGRSPPSACIRNWYCNILSAPYPMNRSCPINKTYSCHAEISEDTPSFASRYAPVPNLRRACVTVHLRELELGLRARALGECRVADHITQCLPKCPYWVSEPFCGKDATVVRTRSGSGGEVALYLSASCSWKTLRLV